MRFLKLNPNDSEVFEYEVNNDKIKFFHKHKDLVYKMCKEQGKTFWLRYLITFQINVRAKIGERPNLQSVIQAYGNLALDCLFIVFHKVLIEEMENENGIYNLITSAFQNAESENGIKIRNKLSSCNSESNSPDTKCFDDFLSNLAQGTEEDDPNLEIQFLFFVRLGFCNGICVLLNRWLKESDISQDVAKAIDRTLFYWRPICQWEKDAFKIECFEKYLSSIWKGNLPKMLLIYNIHGIFSHHVMENCCKMYIEPTKENKKKRGNRKKSKGKVKDLNSTMISKEVSLKAKGSFLLDVKLCDEHDNCFVKILHSDECLNPYLCIGNTLCSLTCETVCKRNWNTDMDAFWETTSIEFIESEIENKRTVSIQTTSTVKQIETFLNLSFPNNEFYNCGGRSTLSKNKTSLNNMIDYKKNEQYRQKIRNKLYKKYEDNVDVPIQVKSFYDEDKTRFMTEIADKNMLKLLSQTSAENPEILAKIMIMIDYNSKLTSVANWSNGVVFGRIIVPNNELKLNQQISVHSATKLNNKLKKKKKNKYKTLNTTKNKRNNDEKLNDGDKNSYSDGVKIEIENKEIESNFKQEPEPQTTVEINSLTYRRYKLRTCEFCLKLETEYKKFKKCSLCKSNNIPDQYYCSRECQIADWKKAHREMHANIKTK